MGKKLVGSTETGMSVLVICDFRVSSTLKIDLTQSTARLHICCFLIVVIRNMFHLQGKIVFLSLLGALAEATWALRGGRLEKDIKTQLHPVV